MHIMTRIVTNSFTCTRHHATTDHSSTDSAESEPFQQCDIISLPWSTSSWC